MDVAQAGVRTTGRRMAAEEAADNSGSVKRRKASNGELILSSSMLVRIAARDGDVITTSRNLGDPVVAELCDPFDDSQSFSSGDAPASCCSSNGTINEKLESSDLDERAKIETVVGYNSDTRESTPTSNFKDESGEPDTVQLDARRAIAAEKKPPAAELEEFFASAEKDLHRRFADRYNYDVTNDVPLKGRYEWVQLKPLQMPEDEVDDRSRA